MSVLKDMTEKWIQNMRGESKNLFFRFPWAILCATHRPVPLPVRHAGNAYFLQVYVYILLKY